MTSAPVRRTLTVIGLCLVVAGATANEWVLGRFLSPDAPLAPSTRTTILLVDVAVVGVGALVVALRNTLSLRVLLVNVLVLGGLLGVAEVGALILARMPRLLPSGPLLELAREWYVEKRQTVQYLDECAEYDVERGYRLRPGRCAFSNTEFSTQIQVNSLGVRDDEQSLQGPEIIVLGDSHAMGWGVDQDQTFAQLIEARSGRSVLNASVPSYGTVRELMLLQHVDTARLRTLVIQYCANDIAENDSFFWNDATLPVMEEAEYRRTVNLYTELSRYRFFEFLYTFTGRRLFSPLVDHLSRRLFSLPAVERPPDAEPLWEAMLFLHVPANGPVDLRTVPTIVLEINPRGSNDPTFVDAVDHLLASEDDYQHLRHVVTTDVSGALEPRHYYRLDDHMRPEGHEVVADALSAVLP